MSRQSIALILQRLDTYRPRRDDALIFGRRGNGKTTLLQKIRLDEASQYPGGVALLSGQNMFRSSLKESIQSQLTISSQEKALVILDDAQALRPDHVTELKELLSANPRLHLLNRCR